jgi:hypothetical protein
MNIIDHSEQDHTFLLMNSVLQNVKADENVTIEVGTGSGAPHLPTAHNCMLPQSNDNQNYSIPQQELDIDKKM